MPLLDMNRVIESNRRRAEERGRRKVAARRAQRARKQQRRGAEHERDIAEKLRVVCRALAENGCICALSPRFGELARARAEAAGAGAPAGQAWLRVVRSDARVDAGIFLQVVDEKVQYLRPTNGCIYHKKKRWVYAAPIPSESGVVAAEAAAAAAAAAEAVAHAASLTRATSYVPTPVNHVRTRYEQSPGDEAAATEGAATASLSTVGHGYAYGDDHRQGFSVALRQQEDGVDYHRRHPFLEQQQQQRHQRQQEQHRTQVKAPPPLVGSGAVGRRRHRPTSSPLTPSVPEGGPLAQHSLHSGLSGLSQSDADPGERGGPAWDHGADRTGTQLLAAAMGGHGTAAAASVDEAGNRSGGGSGSGSGSGGSAAASWQEAVDQDWKTFYKRSL